MSGIHAILSGNNLTIVCVLLVLGTGGWTGTLYYRPQIWEKLVELEFTFYSRFPWIPRSCLNWQRRFCLSKTFRLTMTVLLVLSLFCLGVALYKAGKIR